jgi:hypothetical protein
VRAIGVTPPFPARSAIPAVMSAIKDNDASVAIRGETRGTPRYSDGKRERRRTWINKLVKRYRRARAGRTGVVGTRVIQVRAKKKTVQPEKIIEDIKEN